MRPYTPRGKYYQVPQKGAPTVLRPNKIAAGMAYTASRSGHWKAVLEDAPESLRLSVRGTLAPGGSIRFWTEPKACPCCGSKLSGKLVLNAKGRQRLAHVKRSREARTNHEN